MGASCPLGNNVAHALEGQLIGRLTPVEESAVTLTQTFPEPALTKWWSNTIPRVEKSITELTFDGSAATLVSAFSATLESKEKFGVFEG